ncbi:hypothetical protein GCM10009850_020660 [Nonomuraea monospora]|uniref:Acetyl-coenzyme A carboxylase carboxyl transferase subunits beta/alpha n=1 Tax=Nonomuraea monospora TaxID=568818 RepID=A0ABN3CB80_9ACTN
MLRRAQEKAGTDEAVLTGRASIRGHAAALVVSEFGFLGGSIGVATAERIVAAVRRATRERLPLIAAPASGGTRMQEGTPAFVRMVEISRAVVAHKASGLPYLVYLRHPTTGGVFASWGSLGHVAVAEPGALIGFLGPVVYRTLRGEPFPEGVQVAENLVDKGILDAVVPTEKLAGVAARALALLSGTPRPPAPPPVPRPASPAAVHDPRPSAPGAWPSSGTGDAWPSTGAGDARPSTGAGDARPSPGAGDARPSPGGGDAWPSTGAGDARPSPGGGDAWASISLTRRPDRPGVRELLRHAADDVLPLHGTQLGETDDALLLALTSFSGTPCVLVGQDRRTQSQHRPLGPAALRGARRGMRIAQELRLPLVCVIDTPGADLSAAAEEGALAGEIARCLAEMVELTVPTVSVLLGEGTGGGALALLPSRRVIAAGNAWLSPLPPEGASAILHGGPEQAPSVARRQRVRAVDLLAEGIVHAVVPEHVPAHEDPAGFARRIADECVRQITAQR